MRLLAAIRRFFRQRYCNHVVYYMETMHRRQDGMVEATCDRCRKVFVVEYGLLLPGLAQRPKPK